MIKSVHTFDTNVGLSDRLVNLLVGDFPAEVGYHVPQLGRWDETVAVLIKHLEGFGNLFLTDGVFKSIIKLCEIDGGTTWRLWKR